MEKGGLTSSFGQHIEPLCNGESSGGFTFNSATVFCLENGIGSMQGLIENEVIKTNVSKTCIPVK